MLGDVLLKACLNGSRTRLEHPAVPISHPEVALDAHQAVAAGAGAVHVHPRQADGTETLEAGACGLTLAAIRRVVRVPVGLTTAAWIEPDADRRRWAVSRWEVLPDFASVNVSEPGWQDMARTLVGMGVGVEAGLASTDDGEALAVSGLAEGLLRVLVEVPQDDPEEAVAAARAIDGLLDSAGIAAPRLHHGEGPATWAVLRAAVRAGRNIRVGLEDTLVLPDGRPAADNAELVRAAAALLSRSA